MWLESMPPSPQLVAAVCRASENESFNGRPEEGLALAERAPSEGAVQIVRWQRSGLFDAYPGTVRQVRAGRHGLSQTSLLTIEVVSSAEALGESEVMVANGRVAGLVTGRSGDSYQAIAAPVLAQFLQGAARGDWRSFARAGEPIVKEYQDEFFERHALVLDTFASTEGAAAFEEAAACPGVCVATTASARMTAPTS